MPLLLTEVQERIFFVLLWKAVLFVKNCKIAISKTSKAFQATFWRPALVEIHIDIR